MTQTNGTDFVFHVENLHDGKAPGITHEPGLMHMYFDDAWYEQWLVVFDKKTKRCTLRSGDAGWGVEFDVFDGGVMGMIVGKYAARLVASFWEMATGERATAPTLMLTEMGESETFDPPSQSRPKSLEEVIKTAKACGKKTLLIHSVYSLGSNHSDCKTSLRMIGDAGLTLRLWDISRVTAAMKTKLAD